MVILRSGAIEVLPERLVFVPGLQADTAVLDCLALCANEDGIARGYAVAHYSKSACGRASGPLDLNHTIRFCRALDRRLKQKAEPLHVTSAPFDEAAHTNAIVLIGAYLIFNHGWIVESLTQTLGEAAAARPLPCSWTQEVNDHIMNVRHCWLGFKAAQENQWIEKGCFFDDVHASIVCSRYIEFASTYDAAWLVPGSILLCADPTTVVEDPNPCTFTELWPLQQHSPLDWEHSPVTPITPGGLRTGSPLSQKLDVSEEGPSLKVEEFIVEEFIDVSGERSPEKWEVQPTTSLKQRVALPPAISIPGKDDILNVRGAQSLEVDPTSPGGRTELDSTATVCKDYADANRHGACGNDGSKSLPFFGFLQELHIKMVVRANLEQESGMQIRSYDKKKVKEIGFQHLDLPYPDYHGAVPPADLISKLLCASRGRPADAICVHCKGGFGRSGAYACLLAIDRFDVSGEAMLGWVRIARPGAITTPQQEQFLCSLTGRASLNDFMAPAKCCCAVQ